MAITQQQYQQLSAWLGTLANWQTQTDAQVAAAYGPVYTPVPYATFQTAVMQLAAWGSVRLAGENVLNAPYNASPQLQAAILTAIDLFTNYKGATVDESLPAFQAAMSGLVAAGIVSSADQTAILALGQSYPVPGVTSIQASDVTAARAAIAQFNTAQANAMAIAVGGGAVTSLNNAYQNGPVTATPPTDVQIVQAFATGAFPGKTFTIAGG